MALVGCAPRTGKYNLVEMNMDGRDYLAVLQSLATMGGENNHVIVYLEIVDGKNAKSVTEISNVDETVDLLTYDSNYFYLAEGGSKAGYEYDFIAGTISFSYNEDGHKVEMTF